MATNISFSTYGFMNGILILSEENWRTFFKPFITDSVQNGLATIAGANMTVYVSAGECRCGAVMGILDEMVALDVANSDSTYDRIDSVIVQYTYGEPSTLAVAIVQGTPSANPVPPTLTKVYDTLWQMEIAQILVPSGATSSSEFTITDKRVIYESIESIIDDNTESEERVWSSQKTREEIVSLSTEIYDSLNTKADVIERTVSGDIVTITDGGNNLPVKELVVDIEPVQDLHGYDNPWPAGGGKNLIPLTVEKIKSVNTVGTWSGNNYTYQGVTYKILTDNGNNVVGINVNGTSPGGGGSGSFLKLPIDELHAYDGESLKVSIGLTTAVDYLRLWIGTETYGQITATNSGNGNTFTMDSTAFRFWVQVTAGGTVSNTTVYPMIRLASVTDATFAPYSNICPITGNTSATVTRTGRNLYSIPLTQDIWHTNGGATKSVDGDLVRVSINDPSKVQGVYSDTNSTLIKLLRFLRGKTITYSIDYRTTINTTIQIRIGVNSIQPNSIYLNSTTNWQKLTTTVTLPENAPDWIPFTIYRFSTTSDPYDIEIKNLQIELSSFASPYEPYNGQTVTIDLDGTRYGGVIDVLTGEMTVDRQIADFETMGWVWRSESETWRNQSLINIILLPSSSGVKTTAICENYQARTWNDMFNNHSLIGFAITSGGNLMVRTGSSSETPKGKMVYPLASPLTVQLSENQMQTLLGQNAIWSDTGDVLNLTYRTDTKKYIEQKVADTNRKTCEIMTIVTDKMIAPDNLVIGDLVIVNDDLYKATANIASGATLTVGTNVQKLTLAEYIQSLL